ncbi:MAG: hypothetical protein ACRECR_00960, partial [Thermoplasmata archaeon]
MKAPARDPLDVYLFPAVVGGGLGDIEEVLLAGRRLARAGFRILLFRGPGRPLPRSVEGPWDWPRVERRDRLAPRADRALTVAPWWGVSAAPARPGPLGRAGPWAEECRSVEGTYGTGRVLQVSFEEFARTFTSRRQTAERLREGGVPVRTIRRGGGPSAAEIAEFRAAFTRFRAFDRPDVLHLYPTFSFSPAFRREFPESVQCGPFWPEPMARRPPRRGVWVWYASPGSSPQLARAMARNWPAGARRVRVLVRAPTPFPLPGADGLGFETLAPMAPAAWRDELARAELRIVTGSRTLLEALVLGAPFLYYNGVTGRARGARRHRPEKIEGLLALWRRQGVAPRLRRDLANFARGRDLAGVLARARDDPGWRREFPRRPSVGPFPPGYGDAGGLLEALARAWSRSTGSSEELVARLRRYEPIAPAERGARS